jgi:hypothetical protein
MNDERETPKKSPWFRPGMPTPKSEMLQFLFLLFPAVIGISIALLLPLVQSCRQWARDQAGQVPPPNAADANTNPQTPAR